MKQVLAAIDLSAASLRAADLAAEIAGRFDAGLVLLTVTHGPYGSNASIENYLRSEHIEGPVGAAIADTARSELALLRDRLAAGKKQPIAYDVQAGRPAETIAAFAKRSGTDLIVMGHAGHGGIGRVVLGSVARTVIDTAPCPVLIVH